MSPDLPHHWLAHLLRPNSLVEAPLCPCTGLIWLRQSPRLRILLGMSFPQRSCSLKKEARLKIKHRHRPRSRASTIKETSMSSRFIYCSRQKVEAIDSTNIHTYTDIQATRRMQSLSLFSHTNIHIYIWVYTYVCTCTYGYSVGRLAGNAYMYVAIYSYF